MEIPNFFSGQEKIMSFDFDSLKDLLDTQQDQDSYEQFYLDSKNFRAANDQK